MKPAVAWMLAALLAASPPGSICAQGLACCKTCKTGKACGDICIGKDKHCDRPPGCA